MVPRVLVDASQLTGQSSYSGIGSYVRGLLGALAHVPSVQTRALVTSDADLPAGIGRHTTTRLFRTGRPAVYEHELRRSLELRLVRSDVWHNPNPHAPLHPPRPWVQTLHDVIPLVVDDPIQAGFKRRFERFGPRYAQADAVIAVSRHAANEGMTRLGISASRLEVVPHGVGAEFVRADNDPPSGPPYLLMVCEYSHRKGLAEAIGVIDALADAGYPHHLRIAGRVPPSVAEEFTRLVHAAGHPERVDPVGFVDDLPALYRSAELVLITSRYEGFGFPALEAMACAIPVVAFANTSLTEVVSEGGVLVPDGDVAAAAAAVRRVIDEPAYRDELVERAYSWSANFTWHRSAEAHAAIYCQAANS